MECLSFVFNKERNMHYTLEKPITATTIDSAGETGGESHRPPRARRRTKSVRLCDVARAAGVSTATVSMVVNNNPRISAPTQRRVRRIAERLGYQPVRPVQVLPQRSGNMLTVLLPPRADAGADSGLSDLVGGICQQASRMGYNVLLEQGSLQILRPPTDLALPVESAVA